MPPKSLSKTQNFEEQLWISIRLQSHAKLLLYRSQSIDTTTSTKQLCSLLKIVIDTNPPHLIIMGDFNDTEIDLNYTISRSAENHIFLHIIQDSLLYQHVTQPTRHRLGEFPNILDLILTNEEGLINKIIPFLLSATATTFVWTCSPQCTQRNQRHQGVRLSFKANSPPARWTIGITRSNRPQ